MSRVRLVAANQLVVENGLYPYMFATAHFNVSADVLPHSDDAWGYLTVINERWHGLLIDASGTSAVMDVNGAFTPQLPAHFDGLPNCVMGTDQQWAQTLSDLLQQQGHQVEVIMVNCELRTANR